MRIGVGVALLVSLLAVTADGSALGRVLPQDVRHLLDQKFPGWRFAMIRDSLRAQISPESSPEWVQGDYDDDGRTDYAVQIVRPGPQDTQQVILALLRRGKQFEVYTLKSFGVQQATYLRTSPKGEQTLDVDTDTKVINPADVIEVLYGQEAGETFIYDKGKFRSVISGD